jgi:hypothetical protein
MTEKDPTHQHFQLCLGAIPARYDPDSCAVSMRSARPETLVVQKTVRTGGLLDRSVG